MFTRNLENQNLKDFKCTVACTRTALLSTTDDDMQIMRKRLSEFGSTDYISSRFYSIHSHYKQPIQDVPNSAKLELFIYYFNVDGSIHADKRKHCVWVCTLSPVLFESYTNALALHAFFPFIINRFYASLNHNFCVE